MALHLSRARLALDLAAPVELAVAVLRLRADQRLVAAPAAHDVTAVQARAGGGGGDKEINK